MPREHGMRCRLLEFPSTQAVASVTTPWDPGRKLRGDGQAAADELLQNASGNNPEFPRLSAVKYPCVPQKL